jgi:predicted alpha/beta superfamily hydrolase
MGYPVIYVTDGNAFFCAAAMQADMLDEPALIVGIGYPTEDRREPDILRVRDLTWDEPGAGMRAYFEVCLDSGDVAYGGAEGYLRFITEEVMPTVGAMYATDTRNSTLFGDSLGGLFALHVLLKHPGEFRTYVAGSPAIWWSNKALLREIPAFARAVQSKQASPRVLITVGSLEQSTNAHRAPRGVSRERFEEVTRGFRMVDNARDLALQLGMIRGSEEYEVRYHEFEGETHQSVVAATIGRAISFSLSV